MNQEYIEFKEKLLNTGIFRKVSNGQYRVKDCPYCGDMKYHMYVKIMLTDDSPVLYNCFKCGRFGVLREDFLEYYNLQDLKVPHVRCKKRISNSYMLNANTVDPSDKGIDHVQAYIQSRVGVYPTIEDLRAFQYISNPVSYIQEYLSFSNQIELNNRYWFKLTNGNITGRWIDDNTELRWLKLRSTNIKSKGIYNIKVLFDLMLPIHVYIAEGIFDVIGLYYHHDRTNNIYIATLGKSYEAGLQYLIDRGIFGKSVYVHIFKDNDVPTENIFIHKNIGQLFQSVELYHNANGHDFGVSDFVVEKCLDWKGRIKNGRPYFED